MEKLEDFTLLEPIFGDVPITPNWRYALENGVTKLYNNYGIVNFCYDGDVCVINSGTIDNGQFTMQMKRDIMRKAKSENKCIIYSERHEIKPYMEKEGFRHDAERNLYIKGL